MDVPFLFAHKKALPALPKSIAASSFNFVLILSLSLADLKSISRAATSNSYSSDLEWVALFSWNSNKYKPYNDYGLVPLHIQ